MLTVMLLGVLNQPDFLELFQVMPNPQKRTFVDVGAEFIWVKYPKCHLTISVTAFGKESFHYLKRLGIIPKWKAAVFSNNVKTLFHQMLTTRL